ncbi:DUF998 domain-containing protein [Stenotrophomonas sp. YAU14A_MKIMI4_1]|uniref:DUF998 domain-containing protein n=1 Tax=Stenotrophomonas sp. YAU14A_MKIMI4_1 TaxID=2072408 RepID=UPI000D541915|nr:DUF998 domain-containing protein [Stenotrophomonas sp. YAU14A_MKIMI4_1]AWH29572.1 hypothetical protein C1931_11975 [Stenotrophomonas sp. YAU14A_MKIMI4_1]
MEFDFMVDDTLAAVFVLATTTLFGMTCGVVQIIRKDLDPMHVPLTLYLNGPWGGAVRGAYYAMTAGLIVMAGILWGREEREPLGWVAPVLLVISALSLPVLVVTRPRPGHVFSKRSLYFHRGSTYFTFINLIVAMCFVSLTQGAVGAAQSIWGLLLCILAVKGLALTIFARDLPRGLVQKGLILTIVLWLYWAVASLLVGRAA